MESLPISPQSKNLKVFKTPAGIIEYLLRGEMPDQRVIDDVVAKELLSYEKNPTLIYFPDYFSADKSQAQRMTVIFSDITNAVSEIAQRTQKHPLDVLKSELSGITLSIRDRLELIFQLSNLATESTKDPNIHSGFIRFVKTAIQTLAEGEELDQFFSNLCEIREQVSKSVKKIHPDFVFTRQSDILERKSQHDKDGGSSDWSEVISGKEKLLPVEDELMTEKHRIGVILGDKTQIQVARERLFTHPNVNHEFVLPIDGGRNCRVARFYDYPNLSDALENNLGDIESYMKVFYSALRGMCWLHDQGWYNLDFKPENILVETRQTSSDNGERVTQIGEGIIVDSETYIKDPNINYRTTDIIADLRYHPTGFLLNKDFDAKKADIFSAAIVLLQLCTDVSVTEKLLVEWERHVLRSVKEVLQAFSSTPENLSDILPLFFGYALGSANEIEGLSLQERIIGQKRAFYFIDESNELIAPFPFSDMIIYLIEFVRNNKRSLYPKDFETLMTDKKYSVFAQFLNETRSRIGDAHAYEVFIEFTRISMVCFNTAVAKYEYPSPARFSKFLKSFLDKHNHRNISKEMKKVICDMASMSSENIVSYMARIESIFPNVSK